MSTAGMRLDDYTWRIECRYVPRSTQEGWKSSGRDLTAFYVYALTDVNLVAKVAKEIIDPESRDWDEWSMVLVNGDNDPWYLNRTNPAPTQSLTEALKGK